MGSEFVVYGSGSNPKKVRNAKEFSEDLIREEMAAVTYNSTKWGKNKKPKGPRKMSVVLPKIIEGLKGGAAVAG